MTKIFFDLNDDFGAVIRKNLRGVTAAEQILTGWTNFVFEAKTKRGSFIFRFPRNAFFAAALKKEISFTKFIKNKTTVLPIILRGKKHKGRLFSMHKKVEGHVLSAVADKLTDEQKRLLAADIANYLDVIQKVPADKIRLEPISNFLTGLAHVNGAEYDYTVLDGMREFEKEKILAHGDFNPGNLILDNNYRLIAVLDYAFVSTSCKENDVSRLIGRLPADYREIILKEVVSEIEGFNTERIDYLVELWRYVEADYIDYMKKNHPDIVLPE